MRSRDRSQVVQAKLTQVGIGVDNDIDEPQMVQAKAAQVDTGADSRNVLPQLLLDNGFQED